MTLPLIPYPKRVTHTGGTVPAAGDLPAHRDASLPPEGYVLTLRPSGSAIAYADAAGLFYAKQTLRQLLRPDGVCPCVQIEDAPRFSYRAFMVDSARHMQSIDELKALIEAAARLKFNHFHWHLTDDQGWRMESEAYPRLNEISAYRDCDGFGNRYGVRYGGYYTKAELREIVAFCAERYITVVPEIDMPGHMVALLAAYPALSCTGQVTAVSTHAGIHKDVLCVGKKETYDMMCRLLDEVCAIFPGKRIHIGGDEVPTRRWAACPACRQKMRELGFADPLQLHGWFIGRVAAYLKAKGRTAVAWNDVLKGDAPDPDVVICNWMDRAQQCVERANSGALVIEEDFFHYYMDYPYGMTPLKKTYTFDPLRKGLSAMGQKQVLGVETPIWTEFVRDFDTLCGLCFPRMLAVAERGWSDAHVKNYADFCTRAKQVLPLLEDLGIHAAPAAKWNPRGPFRLGGIVQHHRRSARVARENRALEKEKASSVE